MILDRKTAPERLPASGIPEMNLNPIKLGVVDCYLVEGGTEDIVKIDMVFKAGTRFGKKPLVASICLDMLKEGTEKYSSQEIADTTDFYGAQIATMITKDRATITLLCQGKHLEKLMDVYTDVFLAPVFPQHELTQYKKRSASALAINLDKVEFKARLLFSELMFAGTPYLEQYDLNYYEHIADSDLKEFYQQCYTLSNSFCLISGKDTDRASNILNGAIMRKVSEFNAVENIESIQWSYHSGEDWVKKEGAVQTAIRMGAPALPRSHPDYAALYLANTALGGYFGSRLMQNIREEKGYTYGIGSAINSLEQASYLSISTQVGANFSKLTIQEIKKELNLLLVNPLSSEEFELIQHYITGNLLNKFDGPFATADRLRTLVSFGLPANWYSAFAKAIFELKPEDVCEIAKQYLHPDIFTIAVVGEWPE